MFGTEFGIMQEALARERWPGAGLSSLKEHDSEPPLEGLNPPAECGLGDIRRLCRTPQAAMLSDQHRISQVA